MVIIETMEQNAGLAKLEKSQSLYEQAYAHIKQAIINGVFRPGEFLAEVRLAEDLGISKTPISNAMARLSQEGFLVYEPYKGYCVAEIRIEDTGELYELRRILECYLVRKTAPQFTQAELDEMEANISAAEEAFERRDFISYIAHNREFHHAFPRKYDNHRILKVLANLDEHIQRILLHYLQGEQIDLLSPREHRLVLDAIRAGEVDTAVGLMRDHLSGVHRLSAARSE